MLDRTVTGMVPATIRRWQGIEPDIDQAALDEHFVSIHLGGAKRLLRRGEGHTATRDVESGAYSIVPSSTAFQWQTSGPIDFMHIYFSPSTVDHVVEHAFDRDPRNIQLQESLGHDNPLTRSLTATLLEELGAEGQQQAYLEDILHLLLCQILRSHSNARCLTVNAPLQLAPFRVRRAVDFIEAHLGESIGVSDIAEASGVSRFHFSRAFQRTTGKAPYAYLLGRRICAAKGLLIHSDIALSEISTRCGFASASQFSRMFKQETGVSPSRFRGLQ